MSNTVMDLGVGAAIGYGASRAMDQTTGWYLERQSEASRRREEEIAPGGAPVLAGKKIADMVGREITDEEAAKIGLFVHRLLGVTYGAIGGALVRVGVRPMRAGIITGAAAFLLVDEGVNSVMFTPPPQAYPMENHLRGVIGHLAYGVTAGVMLTMARRLGAIRA